MGRAVLLVEKHQQQLLLAPQPLLVFSTHHTSQPTNNTPAYFNKACASATAMTSSCPKV